MLHLALLFLHVASAMGIVAAFGIESVVLIQLAAATAPAGAQLVLGNFRYVQRTGGISLLLTLITGIALATMYWGWRGAWMGIAFLTIIVIAIIGATLTGRPVTAARRSANSLATLQLNALRVRLTLSFALRLGLLTGIVALMTIKPVGAVSCVLILVIAAAVAVAFWVSVRPRGVVDLNEGRIRV